MATVTPLDEIVSLRSLASLLVLYGVRIVLGESGGEGGDRGRAASPALVYARIAKSSRVPLRNV
jgi:hypothetical protein